MASTYRTIEELYRTTLVALSESPEAWKAFLESAGRNYKLPFPEQALVHAQRPDAKAVLELERWDALFGRRVKRGSVGIGRRGHRGSARRKRPGTPRSPRGRGSASGARGGICRLRGGVALRHRRRRAHHAARGGRPADVRHGPGDERARLPHGKRRRSRPAHDSPRDAGKSPGSIPSHVCALGRRRP